MNLGVVLFGVRLTTPLILWLMLQIMNKEILSCKDATVPAAKPFWLIISFLESCAPLVLCVKQLAKLVKPYSAGAALCLNVRIAGRCCPLIRCFKNSPRACRNFGRLWRQVAERVIFLLFVNGCLYLKPNHLSDCTKSGAHWFRRGPMKP